MLLVCGIAAFFLIGRIPAEAAVPLFLFLIFLIPAIGGLSGLPWFQVFTKTVPVKLRGRLMGIRQLLGSAAGAIGGSLISLVLYAVVFPANFAVLFCGAFFFTMISFNFLVRVVEQPSVIEEKEGPRLSIITEARRIIGSDRNFRHFLFADAFTLMSLAASSFYAVYAVEKFSLPPSYAGTFTAIMMITNVAANIIFGIIADSYGHKVNLLAFALCSAFAGLFAIISTNILMYGLVFFFLACATQIQAISRLPFVAEMCRENERPVYVGIVNTVTAPTVFIGLVFGWFVPRIGYASIFIITSLLAVNSFLILYRKVSEPRK
jgi:MFS family permease